MSAPRPTLVQFGALTPAHFAQHPVWVACHGVDAEQPWYDETDEETFRPWDGELPVSAEAMHLVRCTFRLNDGSEFNGFATPAVQSDDLGTMQPLLFDESGRHHAFWLGMFPLEAAIDTFRRAIARPSSQVFPVRFEALPGLTSAACAGIVKGFMKLAEGRCELMTRAW
jgi:hypothetical protein